MDFQKLTEKVFTYYAQGKYSQALEIVHKAVNDYPKKLDIISYWAACLYTKLNKNKEAIDVLENTFNKGIWWSPKLLTEDPDLEPLYKKEKFKKLVSKCSEPWKEKQSNSEPELTVLTPESYNKNKNFPLLIILHGRNGNVNEFSRYWDIPYLRKKYILAFPQSSQVFGMNSYCWDDLQLAKFEVKSHYKKLMKNYNVNLKSIILAGASQGGRLAIQLGHSISDKFPDYIKSAIEFITDDMTR